MESKKEYQLIMVIVNKGYTDLAMNAATSKGARGGTQLSARGTGSKEIGKFYGIDIIPEKDVVLIIVEKNIADDVIKAIYDACGLDTQGAGIIFSLPVDDVIGLTANLDVSNIEKVWYIIIDILFI